jgi:MFS family permease
MTAGATTSGAVARIRGLFSGQVGAIYTATLLLTVGTGAWFTCWAIFSVRYLGLSAAEFAVALTVAGVLGLFGATPLGLLADRIGARETLVALGLVQAVVTLGYLLVNGFWTFTLVACVAVTAGRTMPGIRMALIAALVPGKERMRVVSTNRVIAHLGMVAGSGLGALVRSADSKPAYVTLIVTFSVISVGYAALVRRVPHLPTMRERAEKRRVMVLGDRPFLAITVLSGLQALVWGMLGVGVPLWITTHTDAPMWAVGAITALNAAGIVLLQNRVSDQVTDVPTAARAALRCGAVLAVSCLLFAATYHRAGVVAVVLLLVAAAAQTAGELYYSSSSWGLSIGLTPKEAHGEYQGMFNTGSTSAELFAPAVMTALVVGWGVGGWLVLAAMFLATGLAIAPVSRWALHSGARERDAEPDPDADAEKSAA